MEAQLNEANTFPTQSYAESFFSELPTDNRFLQRTFVPIPLKSSLKGKTITFVAEKFQAANIYMIQDAHIEIRMVITKQNGDLPPRTAIVGPRNNVLHTVFESCRLYLNDVLFSTSSTDYHYKSYICSTLTYPMNVKANQLQASGYITDSSSFFNDCTANSGFIQRSNLFRVKNLAGNDFRKSGAEFIGRLFHDLIACESGIPPNISIKIELDKSPASFVLQCPPTDKELYDYKFTHAALYIPVGQLSLSVYNELSNLMTRASEGNVAIHYRRLEIRPILLSKGNQDHYFKPLLSESECPCKLIICFVESDAKSGSYHKNPFEFSRSWKYESSNVTSNTEKEEHLKEKIHSCVQEEVRSQMDYFASKIEKLIKMQKEPSQGATFQQQNSEKEQEIGTQKLTENENGFSEERRSSSVGFYDAQDRLSDESGRKLRSMSVTSDFAMASNAPLANSSSAPYQDSGVGTNIVGNEIIIQYIKSISLTINNNAVDQVNIINCKMAIKCYYKA